MQIESLPSTTAAFSMANVGRAHSAMNAAYNALAVDRRPETLVADAQLARDYVDEARAELTPGAGHEASDDARAAARAVLPRLDHALALLAALQVAPDPLRVTPLLDELGVAMDRVEAAMTGAGWDA